MDAAADTLSQAGLIRATSTGVPGRLTAISRRSASCAALSAPLLLASLCAAQTRAIFNNIAGVCSGNGCVVLPVFGNSLAAQFTPATASLATDARVLVIAGGPGDTSPLFNLAIFSDVGGLPGVPVSQVATNLVAGRYPNQGIVTAPFGQPVHLDAQAPYWLVLMPATGAGLTDVDLYTGGPMTVPYAATTSTTGAGGWQIGGSSIGIATGSPTSLQFAVDGTLLPPPLAITTSSPLPNGTVGVAYSQALSATGGTPPYSGWTVDSGALPPGLSLNGSSGAISGVPTTADGEPFSFNVIVRDSAGATSPAHLFSVAIADVPSINAGGVVSAASYASGGVAPGSIASAYGIFLLSSAAAASDIPLPDSISGFSMQFAAAIAAPLYYVSGSQVNLQVPWELAGQSQTTLAATLNGQAGAPQTVGLLLFAPGIFTTNSQGSGQGAILDTSYRLVDTTNPATAGSFVLIYCTGLGAVTNQPPTGSPGLSDPLSWSATPTVTIGGVTANVQFSGLAPGFVGLYQVNAQVPAGSATGPAVPVVISVGGAESNTVTMPVQ